MAWLEGIRGVLCDVDGTLLHGEAAVPGAGEFLEHLRMGGIAFRLTTNTTRRPRREIAEALARAGIACGEKEIVIPARLARRRILESGRDRALLLVPEASVEDFDGVAREEDAPDWVVVGDLGGDFSFDRLNRAFLALRRGAGFVALHKNPWWQAGHAGPVLDAGAFVAALEYATGRKAEVVGKPARAFFDLAVAELGLAPEHVLVVGDDPVNDAAGGAAAGCRTALVRTGRRPEGTPGPSGASPDLVVPSVAQLVPLPV